MKRIICFFFAVVVCFSLMAIPAFADEIAEEDVSVTEVDDETVDEVVAEEVGDEVAGDAVDESYTPLGRIQEFINKYAEEILNICKFVAFAVTYIAYFIWDRLKNKDVDTQLKAIAGTTGNVAVSQGGVVAVANNLIDGYNVASGKIAEMMATYEKLKEKDAERDLLLARVLVQNQTLLEIIQTAYTNSQLPQGTKDLVIFKYAKCLALSDNEEKLASIIGTIHGELTPAIEENAEDSAAEVEEAQEVEA